MKTTRSAHPVHPKIGGIGVQTILAATIGLAITLTLGCSGGNDDPNGNSPIASNCSLNGGTVEIGGQVWMAENLNCDVNGSKCYDNDPANCDKYGRLYNWETARTVCPTGWHLPSDDEWGALMQFVNPSCSATGSCVYAGTKLKSAIGWDTGSYDGNGTDDYGFSALPGGWGSSGGSFGNLGYVGRWWSTAEFGASHAYYQYMSSTNAYVLRGHDYKSYLYSVRCLQD